MNLWAAGAGVLGIAGLVLAWRSPKGLTPLFLLVGAPLTAAAVLRGLFLDGVTGVMLGILAVPYWGLWLALYMIGGVQSGRSRRPPPGDR